MSTTTHDIKKAAYEVIDQLPDNTTWDDVLYRMTVRRSIELGLHDSDSNNTVDTKTVRSEFGLPSQTLPDK